MTCCVLGDCWYSRYSIISSNVGVVIGRVWLLSSLGLLLCPNICGGDQFVELDGVVWWSCALS